MTEKEPVRCAICSDERTYTVCIGCGQSVCEPCVRMELIGSGCGCVWPAYYCLRCVSDPLINPNALLRDPEPDRRDREARTGKGRV